MSPSNPPAIGAGNDRPQVDRNGLQHNRGDGTYAEISQFAGIEATGWSWSLLFLDVDLDGFEDVLLATGNMFNPQDLDANNRIAAHGPFRRESISSKLLMYPSLNQPKLAFRNRGDLTFEEVGARWGFDQIGVAHGMALADLDNDGDCDAIVNNLNAAAGLYRNDGTAPRIAARLKGVARNTRGIGARIKVLGGPVPQSQEMICGGRYLSSDEAIRTFAAGNLTNELQIQVAWRSGKQSVLHHAQANRIYEIEEPVGSDQLSVIGGQSLATTRTTESGQRTSNNEQLTTNNGQPTTDNKQPPLFHDVSALLNHTHHEEMFDDFSRQPLLPNKLSQAGPGVSWFDLDNDGWEDVIIGTGKGGPLAAYRHDGKGGFQPMAGPLFSQVMTRDQTGVVAWRNPHGHPVILAGSTNYEDGLPVGSCVREFDLAARKIQDRMPGQPSSTGPLALGDMDGDGVLDLFVGGRAIGGRYPEPASSLLFRNNGDKWVLNEQDSQALREVGLVTGAVWSDLDGDGSPELVLACEWGPVRILARVRGQLREVTDQWGLDQHLGWWNGVNVGDFDGDGRLDLVVSNWGLNTAYRASATAPRRVYYGDVDGNGTVDLIESSFDRPLHKWVPDRDLRAMAAALSVGTICHAPSLRRGECARDSGRSCGIPRNDAGRGLLLRGDETGRLVPVAAAQSGIRIYGEQRGCAWADYDHDGRADLVVTQNGATTCLFHNATAKPGLRVRLAGPPGNPGAIGAAVRLRFHGRAGPVREIHAGSGYLSQDAAVQVMGAPEEVTELEVRWPGGKSTVSPCADLCQGSSRQPQRRFESNSIISDLDFLCPERCQSCSGMAIRS